MPKITNLAAASYEDVGARLEELKKDFINLPEGRRSADPNTDPELRSMLDEVHELDRWIDIVTVQQRATQQRKLAATFGVTMEGLRTIGQALVTEDMLGALERSGDGGHFRSVVVDGKERQLQNVYNINLDGDKGKSMTRWLKAAGILGGSRLGDPEGIRAAITEWGSSGPGSGGTNFDSTDAGGLLPRLGQPIPPVPRQAKLYLRDLIPTMPTTLAAMPYVRELNPVTYENAASGGATTVAEGSPKPAANLSFVSEVAPVTTVATTLTLSKQMFADAQAVIAYINQRLPYLVKLAEDNQFLNGNGTWPNLTGILNTVGVQSQGTVNTDYAQTIGQGFADVENVDGQATAVVMNPTDAWTMFTKRAAGGSGTFDAGTPFGNPPLTVWGVPTYRSRVYPPGSALVADFERGAMIVDREQVNLQTYNERYAEQNLVLLICEERLGLMVFRPDLFVQCTL